MSYIWGEMYTFFYLVFVVGVLLRKRNRGLNEVSAGWMICLVNTQILPSLLPSLSSFLLFLFNSFLSLSVTQLFTNG